MNITQEQIKRFLSVRRKVRRQIKREKKGHKMPKFIPVSVLIGDGRRPKARTVLLNIENIDKVAYNEDEELIIYLSDGDELIPEDSIEVLKDKLTQI
jgi:hypothetical protein